MRSVATVALTTYCFMELDKCYETVTQLAVILAPITQQHSPPVTATTEQKTSTFEYDLDSVNMNHRAKYLRQRAFGIKSHTHTHTHTHHTDCSTWTTAMVG